MISDYHVDLWEHASKLYHLRHWQQAADIFAFLGKDIASSRERTLCLVNKALAEAQLGDYDKAALTVADAADLGEDLPITAFLAGLVNSELGQLTLAESWFEACLNGMETKDVDCSENGMDFVLEYGTVQRNLESVGEARMAADVGYEDAAPDDLCHLPAELIFEAPCRTQDPTTTPEAISQREWYGEPCAQNSAPTAAEPVWKPPSVPGHVPSSPHSVASWCRDSPKPWDCEHLTRSPDTLSLESDLPSAAASPGSKQKHTPILIRPSSSVYSPSEPSTASSSARELRALERIRKREAAIYSSVEHPVSPRTRVPYTWHGRQKPILEPRDARGVGDSTRELARFVREYAPEESEAGREIAADDAERKVSKTGKPSFTLFRDPWASSTSLNHSSRRESEERSTTGQHSLDNRNQTNPSHFANDKPSRPRAFTAPTWPVRSSSLPKKIQSPKGDLVKRRRRKLTIHGKMRWPFQDDDEEDDEFVQQAQALARAQTLLRAPPPAIKAMPFDVILGPKGENVFIERGGLVHTPASADGKRANTEPGVTILALPRPPPPRAEPRLPFLHPTTYQPSNLSISSPLTSPSPDSSVSQVPSPAWRRGGELFLASRPLTSEAMTLVEHPAGGSPSVVSSVDVWERVLGMGREGEG